MLRKNEITVVSTAFYETRSSDSWRALDLGLLLSLNPDSLECLLSRCLFMARASPDASDLSTLGYGNDSAQISQDHYLEHLLPCRKIGVAFS